MGFDCELDDSVLLVRKRRLGCQNTTMGDVLGRENIVSPTLDINQQRSW
jgi:hypothetical protein